MTITAALIPFMQMPNGSFSIPPARWIDHIVLAANVAQTYTFPNGAVVALISANADFYAAWRYLGDATPPTATVPAATVSTGAGMDLNPNNRYVAGITAVSLISAGACIISIASYEL